MVLVAALLLGAVSCATTNTYTKSADLFYEDGKLVTSVNTETKDGKIVKNEREVYKQFAVEQGAYMVSVRHKADLLKEKGEGLILVYDSNRNPVASCDFTERKGKIVLSRPLVETEPQDMAVQEAVEFLQGKDIGQSLKDKSEGSLSRVTTTERITVESKPDGKWIAYSFLGRPFVVIGSTVWSVLKCTGYAFVNFLGGNHYAKTGQGMWMVPSVKDAVAARDAAKAANSIQYEEYHKTFTKNHITVESATTTAENVFTSAEKISVTAHDVKSFDNTIRVANSVKADSAATASVVNVIGNVVTIPVSGLTWVGGFCLAQAGF